MTGPDTPRRRRRLAAILMADVVGFSTMMGRDEEGTTARILAFHDLMREAIEGHGGRVVGTAGDSVLGDFDSIVEALECASGIQRALHQGGVDRPPHEQIQARIGLHLGDVIVEERNVFGEGVNVAARLEELADPGGILVSEAVHQVVKGRTDLPMERLGVRELKNIDEPIAVYRIGPEVFGSPETLPAPSEPADGDTSERIRSAIARLAEVAADRAEEAAANEDAAGSQRDSRGPAVVSTGALVLVATGVLGILARTSGWSDNAWYPFVGAWVLAIGVGQFVERVSTRPGISLLFQAVGVAVGAVFFTNVVTRALLWILATAMLGGAIQQLAVRR